MKTKIRQHTRSVLSVVLSVCMLISCMTVGLIATDAAKIADDSAVGWNEKSDRIHIRIGSDGWTDIYFSSAGTAQFTVSADNTTVEFLFYLNGSWYKWESASQGNYNAADMHKTSGCQRRAMTKGSKNYSVSGVYADTYTVTLVNNPSNGEQEVKISGNGGSSSTDWYIYGHKWFTSGSDWNDTTKYTKMNYDETNQYYYVEETVSDETDYFRLYNGSTHYQPSGSSQFLVLDDTNGITPVTGQNHSFGIYESGKSGSLTVGTEIRICWNGTKVWVITNKQPLVTSLVLTATKTSLTAENETTDFNVSAEGLQSGVTNLTYKLFKADGTQVGSPVTVTDGSLTATFANVDPAARSQEYYATVEETVGTDYKSVTSNTVTVTNSNDAYKPSYTITYSAGANGAVQAYDDNGDTIASGASVKEGKHVTLKATPSSTSYRFKNWTGASESLLTTEEKTKSAVTLTVYSNITLQGNFEMKGYAINAGSTTNHNMTELSNGWYISTSTYGGGAYFKIRRLSDSKVTKPKDTSASNNGCSFTSRETKKDVDTWVDDSNWDYRYAFHADNSTAYYVVFDPKNNQVWLSAHEDGQYKIKVIAKDGTIRGGNDGNGYYYKDHCAATFGDTTITVVSNPAGCTLNPYDDQVYDTGTNNAQTVDLTAAQARQGVKLKIRTTVSKANYFVKGFDVNGGETQGVISQEFEDDGTEKASYPDRAKIYGTDNNNVSYNEFIFDVQGYEDAVIEITPIY